MVEKTVRCDRCREVIDEGRSLLRVEAGPLRSRRETIDLCEGCTEALVGWLDPADALKPTAAPRVLAEAREAP